MPRARIYQPSKTAVQSGRAKTRFWILEPEMTEKKVPDPLMGWVGSGDTGQQVMLRFPTKEAAIAYARKHGIEYRVYVPHRRVIRPKSYADNFIRRV